MEICVVAVRLGIGTGFVTVLKLWWRHNMEATLVRLLKTGRFYYWVDGNSYSLVRLVVCVRV